ncbi:energy transducer TonB [Thiorhodospira sibirica]|uniref:energy transducer TonB n=1 Tax=Thiorhodospira sibirica TaxID=154347 RepID=UPI00022C2DDB|nr:energy transducer TonB [Thiorhodospira sibirica]
MNTFAADSVTPVDRLGLALFLAATVHAVLILGVSFGFAQGRAPAHSAHLDVTLVQTASDQSPEQAKLIAQADQLGSGTLEESLRPSAPLSAVQPLPTDGLAHTQAAQATTPRATDPQAQQVLVGQAPALLAQQDRQQQAPHELPPADRFAERSLEMARLAAEIAERDQRYAERPRVHFMDSVSTKTAVEAAYLDSWVNTVERIGNLNYPDDARRRRLHGTLVVNVLLNHTGEVLETRIATSSGEQVLDDAARRIVDLAKPFDPFPADMKETYDQLWIIRTWIFQGTHAITTR